MMPPAGAVESSVFSSSELPPNSFADTVQAVARVIFIVIGSIFSTIAVVAMFIDLAVPSPLLLLIGGIAFIALGIFMPKRESLPPPLPQPPISDPYLPNRASTSALRKSHSDSDLRRLTGQVTFTARPESSIVAPDESLDPNVCCPRSHVLLENEQQVNEIVGKNLQQAEHQLKSLAAIERHRIPRTPTTDLAFQVNQGIAGGHMYGTCSMPCKEECDYTAMISGNKISFEYRKTSYKASFIASVYGDKADTSLSIDYLDKHLGEYLTVSILEYTPLTHGYYNALSTLYDHLELDLALVMQPFLKMLVVLFLREHLWIANLGTNQAILFQRDEIVQLSCCKDLQEPAVQKTVLAPPPSVPFDTTLPLDDSDLLDITANSCNTTAHLDSTGSFDDFEESRISQGRDLLSTPLEPTITRYRVNDIDGYLVIGSPGFWQTLSPQDVRTFLQKYPKSSLQDLAYLLMRQVHANGFRNAATVTVLRITPGFVKADADCDAHSDAGSVYNHKVPVTDRHFS